MALLNTFILLAVAYAASAASIAPKPDPVTEGTELVFAFMTHRHGDRTPVSSTLSLLGAGINTTLAEELIEVYDYGQLTDAGKRTGYLAGEFIRRRYNDIIASKYNKTEMYIRSTDSTRVKKTALAAMAAVFPAGRDNWSNKINWDPTPYTTVPAKYDYNEAVVNCPTFISAYYSLMLAPNSRMNPYTELIEKIYDITGLDLTSYPVELFAIYDVLVSLESLGYPLSESLTSLMGELKEAAGVGWDIIAGDSEYLSYQAGPFLNEFFEYAAEIIAGTETQSVRIYSAHDFNVYSLVAITQAYPRPGAPKYASLYSLELRKVVATGQYVVLPVYLADPHVGVETYLQVEGCDGEFLCDYDTFYSIVSGDLRDEDTWRDECGFTADMTVDTSSID